MKKISELDLSTEEIISQLQKRQKASFLHEYTCCSPGFCQNHGPDKNRTLIPTVVAGSQVVLKCPCGLYAQDTVQPEDVIRDYDKLEEEWSKKIA